MVKNFAADSASWREAQTQAYLRAEARRPFDVANEPLVRLSLLRLAEEEHILFVNLHHCIADGGSIVALLEELKAAYQAFAAGQACSLPELPIQYTDFALWQREKLQPQRLEPALAYWQQQLRTPLPVLELPSDHPRPAVPSSQGATYTFAFSPQLREDLEQFSSYTGVTLFMTLLAAFQTVLFRYTGQTDLIVGAPISDRSRPDTRGLVGLFINTLVLRTDLSGNPTFRDLLFRVRKTCLAAYAHQQLPFDQLVEAVQPERTLSHTPLFQTMFAFLEIPDRTLDFPGLEVSLLPADSGTAKFDLSLSLTAGIAPGLNGSLEYRTDLFEEQTMVRLVGHLQTVLESIVENPEQPLSTLPLLTRYEQQQFLVWNATEADYPRDACIHDLFEAQITSTPEAPALRYEGEELSYQDLNRRANQLAHHLRKVGVGPEAIVAICMERSVEMMVGVLGILKAGGAYVPLDPRYPQERLAFMLADAQAAVLLTQQRLLEGLPPHRAHVVCVDADRDLIARGREDNPIKMTTPDNLAYVIYTSGSTGRPKAVAMSHRPLVNLISWQLQNSTLPNGAKTLQFASLSFDVSFQEAFSTWCAGGTLVLIDDELRRDAAGLVSFLKDQAVERLFLPFVALHHLSETAGEKMGLTSLREVVTAGEQLQITQPLARWFNELTDCTLYNQYGPSESHVVTAFTLTGPSNSWPVLPPIGRPIANTQIYLLDSHLQPVPIGVPGELYIGGVCLARGYLGRPELTDERFVKHPFSREPDARLYRTGDLARYLPDGNIEFLGRTDHQVKIRGFRIELGEIESVLGAHPLVQETVVVVREDVTGDPRLVAYIVAKQTAAPPSATELRHFLAEKLPDYMLPAHIVFLDTLPLTPNGKTDRQALPAPDQFRPDLEQTYVAPRTPDEKAVAQIWQQVLNIEQIGIHDNFFELGGHSLQTVQIVSKISAAFDQQLPVKWLFLYPTIASLAAAFTTQVPHKNDRSRRARAATGPSENHPSAQLHNSSTKPSHTQATQTTQVTIEHRPLLSLFATGQLAPVQAAAIASLPDTLLEYTGLAAEDILHGWCQDMPLFQGMYETALGRIALLLIPQFSSQLYHDQSVLLDHLVEALTMAKTLGAQTVSLTGILPSATDYGRALAERIGDRQGRDLPRLTTGHATTAATVVLSIRRIVAEAGRSMPQERVGVLGLGSIGMTTLRLMLSSLPHPEQLILCDVYEKRSQLETLRQELINDLHFHGPVHIVDAQASVPPAFYHSTLIVGASNVPDILDVHQLQPGTLIVDDSAPHCFSAADAVRRFQDQADLLFTEGGVLQAPTQIRRQFYLPRQDASRVDLSAFTQVDPYEITGCIFSSLLSARFAQLPPMVGLADNASSRQHYEQLEQLDFQAARLHCEGYVLETQAIERFRQRFGHSLERIALHSSEERVL